jgi:hypothetical protein
LEFLEEVVVKVVVMLRVVDIVDWVGLFGGAPALECLGAAAEVVVGQAEEEDSVDLVVEVLVEVVPVVNGKNHINKKNLFKILEKIFFKG